MSITPQEQQAIEGTINIIDEEVGTLVGVRDALHGLLRIHANITGRSTVGDATLVEAKESFKAEVLGAARALVTAFS